MNLYPLRITNYFRHCAWMAELSFWDPEAACRYFVLVMLYPQWSAHKILPILGTVKVQRCRAHGKMDCLMPSATGPWINHPSDYRSWKSCIMALTVGSPLQCDLKAFEPEYK